MILVDVHAHLHLCEHPQDVISRAALAGVKRIITTGLDEESNTATLSLSNNSSIVQAAIGLHPTYLSNTWERQFEIVQKQILHNKERLAAIGEVGLDSHDEHAPPLAIQERAFQEFLKLSEKTKLPLIIHSRKEEEQVINHLQSSTARAILHSFGGNKKIHRRAVDEGHTFSIPSNCERSTHYQDIIKNTPLSQLLTETDTPYQPAVAGTKSEPAYVKKSIHVIAAIKKLTPEETANNIFMNYTRIFQQ